MGTKHMNLFFPQWQGAGSKELLDCAREIKGKYIKDEYNFIEIPVDDEDVNEVINNIFGYDKILQQLKYANMLVSEHKPNTIFTVGGGCDVELIPVSYLNYKLKGDMSVIWLDAHGDLNTPESSPSKLFHGMPLRALLGDGDEDIVNTAFSKLSTSQLVLIGQRDLDEPEKDYIDEHEIDLISVGEVSLSIDNIIERIKSKGSRNIYIHIDLDVLDLKEFPYVMVPSPNGVKTKVFIDLIYQLKSNFKVVGLSLLEYASSTENEQELLSEIICLGSYI